MQDIRRLAGAAAFALLPACSLLADLDGLSGGGALDAGLGQADAPAQQQDALVQQDAQTQQQDALVQQDAQTQQQDAQVQDDGPHSDASAVTCPTNYVPVPALSGYTTTPFCVAKYEMKNVGGVATSQAAVVPWTTVSRTSAITNCQALGAGYDLITNAEWQTIARTIAGTASNWSSGTAYVGTLNRGHTDGTPHAALEATTDDNDSCYSTGQTCSGSAWNEQRRTHRLADGSILWDFGGNAGEIVKDSAQGTVADGNVVDLTGSWRALYGSDQNCDQPAGAAACGFGAAYLGGNNGAAVRGGGVDWGTSGGVFTVTTVWAPNSTDWDVTFRCVYAP